MDGAQANGHSSSQAEELRVMAQRVLNLAEVFHVALKRRLVGSEGFPWDALFSLQEMLQACLSEPPHFAVFYVVRSVAGAEADAAAAVTARAVACAPAAVDTGFLVAGWFVHGVVATRDPGLRERQVVRLADCCQHFGNLSERRSTALRTKLLTHGES